MKTLGTLMAALAHVLIILLRGTVAEALLLGQSAWCIALPYRFPKYS
jgi:hypothetical protein